jgi:hypothetical protein
MASEDRTGKVLHLSVHSLTVLRKLHLRSAYSLPAQRNQKTQRQKSNAQQKASSHGSCHA